MQPKYISVGFGLQWRATALAGAIVALSLAAAPALAAPAAPAWKLAAISAPTNFAAGDIGTNEGGPTYLFEATNVGGAPTGTPVTIQVTLPPGVSPSSVAGTADGLNSPQPSCSSSAQVVTCTTLGPVQPSRSLAAQIVVDTGPGLSGSPVAEATVSGGGAAPAMAVVRTPVTSEPPSFGFLPGAAGLAVSLTEADGSAASLAGAHPYQLTVDVGFPSMKVTSHLLNSGHPRNVVVDLPRGLLVNPTATPTCTESELMDFSCPPASQVGIVTLTSSVAVLGADSTPLYNMASPPGSASNFGFNAGNIGVFIHLLGSLRAGDYGLSATVQDLLARFPLLGMRLQFWGDPSSSSHDGAREASVPPLSRPLLTMPSSCGQLVATAVADSWEEPGVFVERHVETQDLEGNPVRVSGCGELAFSPTLEARPTTGVADSPSGLDVGLEVPQTEAFDVRATSSLKRAQITLPEGLVANPSGANGLKGCSPAQIGLMTPVGSAPVRFDDEPAACPDAARIGAAEVDTHLLDHLLHGSVFLTTPHENPFGSLLALYVVAEDESSGVVLKLAGEVEADPDTGRLSASFDELPQLPIASIGLRFFGGAAAPLRTPAVCGTYATTSSLTPWSAPESGPPATLSDGYAVDRNPSGAACATSAGALPNAPSLDAGSVTPRAGAYTPFVLDLRRADGTQQLSSVALTLPPGLTGRLAGIPYCSDAVLGAERSGALELTDPRCPAASRVGSATVGAGAGPAPYFVHGDAYLAGPYKGAPLSLAVVVPALAGPFDLGTVVLRSALRVDPRNAQVTAVSDPVPAILRGIPLDLRSLRIVLDRPGFVRNPTSCDPRAVQGRVAAPTGPGASLSKRFQMGDCRRLGFAPRVAVRLLGPTHRGAHPRLRTVLTARPGDANVRRLAVTLSGTELLDSRRIGAVCDRERFAAGRCPAGSLQGHARAWSPLLEQPLEGPVYLRASDSRLPELAASLRGQVDLDLVGRVDSVGGRLRTTFQGLPDVPLTRVVLTVRGGAKGVFVNTGGLCAGKRRATVELDGQNGKAHDIEPVVRTDCRPAKRG